MTFKPGNIPHNRKDYTGQRFGRLVATRALGSRKLGKTAPKTVTFWEFQCDCGAVVERRMTNILGGSSQSCGCLRKEQISALGKSQAGTKKAGPGGANRTAILRNYKNNAKLKNRCMDLTDEQIISLCSQNCAYCNRPINEIYQDDVLWDIKYNGIDRINSKIGYTMSNCVPCCSVCNTMKMDMTVEQFKTHIVSIYAFLELGSLNTYPGIDT